MEKAGQQNTEQYKELQKSLETNRQELEKYETQIKNDNNALESSKSLIEKLSGSLDTVGGSTGGVIQGFKGMLTAAKAFIANPIGLAIAAIATAVMTLVNAMKQSGAATEKFNQILAPFELLLSTITAVLGKLVSTILDGVLAFGKLANALLSIIPGMDKLAERDKQAINLEREKQSLIRLLS